MIDDGAVVAEGTPDQLKDRVGDDRMRVTAAKVEDLGQLTKVLARFTSDQPLVDEEQRTVSVPMTDGIGGIASVAAELAAPTSRCRTSR